MRKRFYLMVVALCFSILVACGNEGASTDEGTAENGGGDTAPIDDLFVTVASGGTSGVYYPIAGAIAQILESDLGLATSVQATGASVENVNLISNSRAELAITMADTVLQAYEGSGEFEGEEPIETLRGLASLYPNFVQIVTTEDSGIETVDDLRGKSVGVGAPNSGVELNARMVLEAHGMSYDDIEEDYLSYSEAIDQIKNGLIDAAFVTSGVPNATVIDLGTTHSAKIIPIEGQAMDYLTENYPFFSEGAIPAGSYDNEEEIPTAAITNVLLISHEIDEEVAYEITKSLFEHLDEIHASHNAATDISLETVEVGMPVPFHPGAERYFKEVGVLD
ncbi:TAXI family TRAP transporter solute-binding subunit [Halalkalibacterium halodurans]|jgi:TRAP transporter TAXI family solute receptor|uniref:C4-dicarboxylate ABC transporter substrate-binding protein n=1 Tax=Halalkalibacterium halodurans TaxID=86665 RepID=A0A0M0KIN7_ALKHA|nr:TAXI family TRAP transporter solute-binding subunit [Halalkalibacterium halodurans]MED4080857.1 TAXI family TRAP transporter solute-binding subunit [Halalkalibacterium halodurans]MED4086588.1 TAXI family TRAP transporter solute-binding subunit [Halalkalibacterium halodurans]MED4106955.1 TAXI family TRAP transporter solute-binding subunit [Halalkalibacterium halodurans]MED4110330.1 TAXI family TRAP transporter solute-binding subunit [Halalkalibacterium halodurans]MED4149916.1 TAXI family TRA